MTEADKLKSKWQKDDEAEVDAAIRALLEHRHGRRLLWWMLQIGGVGKQPFANNALNTAFNCGELNVGQRLLDRLIFVSPQGYVSMMQENASERTDRDAALKRAYDTANGTAESGEYASDGAEPEPG